MKKRLLILVVLALLVISGGMWLHKNATLADLTAKVEKTAVEVSYGYIDIVDTQVRPLLEKNLLPTEHPAAMALTPLRNALQETIPIEVRLKHISQLQIALWDLVESASVEDGTKMEDDINEEETQTPSKETNRLEQLKKSIGNAGAIRDQIEAYNSAAIRWNRAQERSWQGLRARVTGDGPPRLPFMRVNGDQEWVPIIQI